jgi:hypothetical protein
LRGFGIPDPHSAVAGSGHEFYIMNMRTKRAWFEGKSREGQDIDKRLRITKPTQLVS